MEKATVENFLSNWNGLFPEMILTLADLKKPQALMAAVFHIFDRLGISRDAVMMAPEQPDEHTIYYRDLIPVINTTRIINHVVCILPEANLYIPIMHLLQPTVIMSYTILMVLFNVMVFNEARLEDIASSEGALFAFENEVKALTEKKGNLIQMRNMEAVEKCTRAERIEQYEHQIPILEEEVKQEKEIEADVLKESEAMTKQNKQSDVLLDQKKTHREGILAENARKKALKVYDAEDIRGQAEQAAQNVREAEKQLSALSATLAQKETSLNNLQTVKSQLDQTNTLLHDIIKMTASIKDFENGDFDTDSAEGELEVLVTELSELEAAFSEGRQAAELAAARRRERAAARDSHRRATDSALKECEEKQKRGVSEGARARQLAAGYREGTARHERDHAAALAEITDVKEQYVNNVTMCQNRILNKMKDVYRVVEEQSQRRRKL